MASASLVFHCTSYRQLVSREDPLHIEDFGGMVLRHNASPMSYTAPWERLAKCQKPQHTSTG